MSKVNRRGFLKVAAGTVIASSLAKTSNIAMATAAMTDTNDVSIGRKNFWSLVILPDTQHYVQKYPGMLHMQTQWLLENKNKYNIAYVLQAGDVTNNNIKTQWQRASQAFARLDGKMPYALALGNHDFGLNGKTNDRTTMANDYFPVSRFKKMPTFGGTMEPGKIDNTFHTFKAGGKNYIVISLEFGPRNEALEWANQIVKKYPNHKVIILTHAYLYSDSTRNDWQIAGKDEKYNPHEYKISKTATTINDGQEMWDKLVKKHPNIFMTINGHVLNDGLGYRVDKGDNGNNVHQMLVNFQMLPVGGEAWLRILSFMPDDKTVEVRDYSPLYEEFNAGEENKYTITL